MSDDVLSWYRRVVPKGLFSRRLANFRQVGR